MRTLNLTFAILLLALHAQAARADSFACGKDQDKGPEQSEIGFVAESGSPSALFLDGKAVPADKMTSKSIDNDHVLVSADRGRKGTLELLFSSRDENVKKTLVSDSGVKKALGTKQCVHDADGDDNAEDADTE